MLPETHISAIKESLEVIKEAVQRGIERRQRTIGFVCSAAAVDLLELSLHQKGILPYGNILKHDWFASKQKASRKLPFSFDEKEKILSLLEQIEKKRNILCYGKPQPRRTIEEFLETFHTFKELMGELGVDYE